MNENNSKMQKLYSELESIKKVDSLADLIFILQKINDFSKSLSTKNDYCRYESMAFNFIECSKSNRVWKDLNYNPSFSINYEDNKTVHNLEVSQVTKEMISYWKSRAFQTNNPILKFRYSGLAWGFSKIKKDVNADISLAHFYADSLIQIVEKKRVEFIDSIIFENVLDTVMSINDIERVKLIQNLIIQYERDNQEIDKAGTWGYSFKLLVENQNTKFRITKEDEALLVKDLEKKLSLFSNVKSDYFNSRSAEIIILKLHPYYKKKDNLESTKRVLLIYRDSVLHSVKKGSRLSGVHFLEKVRRILFENGLSKEAKELEPTIVELQEKSLKEFQKLSYGAPISQDYIDQYKKGLDEISLSSALDKIIFSFIPNKDQSKKQVLEISKKNPFQFLVSQEIVDHRGRKLCSIKDMDDHAIRNIVNVALPVNCTMINLGLNHLQQRGLLNTYSLLEYVSSSPLFKNKKNSYKNIEEGIEAFFNQKFFSSCLILVTQIEYIIRETVKTFRGNIYTSDSDIFHLKSLGVLLHKEPILEQIFPEDILIYFKTILVDDRGLNLRNRFAHGEIPYEEVDKSTSLLLIHILLLLLKTPIQKK